MDGFINNFLVLIFPFNHQILLNFVLGLVLVVLVMAILLPAISSLKQPKEHLIDGE